MRRDVAVITRSAHEELYAKAQQFFDPAWKKYRAVGTDAYGYVVQALELEHDWVVNIDEDCFLYDYRRVSTLIDYMEAEGFHYAGQADGGVTVMRDHNPLSMNPFFNVFHTAVIRKNSSPKARKFEGLEARVDPTAMKFNYPHHSPDYQLEGPGWKFNYIEPYYPAFFWLLEHFRPLWLGGKDFPFWNLPILNETQPATVLLDHQDEPLAIHAWYAREYHCNPWYRSRINQCFTEAIRQREHYAEQRARAKHGAPAVEQQ